MSLTAHTDDCSCTRCRGFQAGHELSIRHGAYARLLQGRDAVWADDIRRRAPAATEVDEPLIALAGTCFARYEFATAAMRQVEEAAEDAPLSAYTGPERQLLLGALRKDARSWLREGRAICAELGIGVRSRFGVGLQLKELATNLDPQRLNAGEEHELRRLLLKMAGEPVGGSHA